MSLLQRSRLSHQRSRSRGTQPGWRCWGVPESCWSGGAEAGVAVRSGCKGGPVTQPQADLPPPPSSPSATARLLPAHKPRDQQSIILSDRQSILTENPAERRGKQSSRPGRRTHTGLQPGCWKPSRVLVPRHATSMQRVTHAGGCLRRGAPVPAIPRPPASPPPV